MDYIIREMKESEYFLLEDFLYEAIFQREGETPFPRSLIENEDLQVYIRNFGTKPDDYCLCAEVNQQVIAAVWVRNIQGYGSVDEKIPEFAISVYKEYRGQGIGKQLMKHMLEYLQNAGYRKVSLAVQKDNYAVKMYRNLGFYISDESSEEYIMIFDLNREEGDR